MPRASIRLAALTVAVVLTHVVTGSAATVPAATGAPRGATPAPPPKPGRRIALLIAISDYRNLKADGPSGLKPLEGPVEHDLPRMRRALRKWGFGDSADTRVLTDSQASRAGIEAGFRWLASQVRDTSDVVVIYFSGHGTSAPDGADRDEAVVDPNDHDDEALVPWDVQDTPAAIHDARQLVIDDQIRDWLAAIRTDNVTMIVDACYSGTITRGESRFRSRGPAAPASGGSAASAAGATAVATTMALRNPKHTVITAASPRQRANEIEFSTAEGDRYFGVLTYFLTEALLFRADSTTRYDDVMQDVQRGVTSLGYQIERQDPQLEGERGALLFRVRQRVAREPVLTLASRGADTWRVDLGAVHGLRVGALLDVYAPEDSLLRNRGALGQVEVVAVRSEDADVRRPAGATELPPIPARARATLAMAPRGVRTLSTLPVWIAPDAVAARPALDSLAFVTASDSASAAAVVRRRGAGYQVTVRGVPLPSLKSGADPARGYAASRDELCSPLRRALAIASLGQLVNPAATALPRVTVRAVPTGTLPSHTLAVGEDTVRLGETVDVLAYVDAPRGTQVYLSAAVAGFITPPTVIYPDEDHRGKNDPVPLQTWIPLAIGLTGEPPVGREAIKVVAELRQYDLYLLVESLPACGTRAGGSKGDDEVSRIQARRPAAVSEWKAVEHSILILDPAAKGRPQAMGSRE